jgi:two-component system response regulator VanR
LNLLYLAIEKDDNVHERESKFWLSRNVSSVRVSSMTEGIEAAIKQQFLYIGINADNINYKPQLPHLREATHDPIFIASSTYTMQEQGIAVRLGADLFGEAGETPNDNYDTVMANIDALQERIKRRKPSVKTIPYGNVLIAPKHRQVFVYDKEIELTRIDFDLLYYFMNNRGHVLSSEQIFSRLWKNERAEAVDDIVKSAIKRLRQKLNVQDTDNSFILNVWGQGYKLPVIPVNSID